MIVADPAPPQGPIARAGAWLRGHVPTRESIEANRFLRPVAHRILVPSLWRLNRRSVPRGVALGVFSGILFPFAHMAIAAVLALPARANVPTAVGTTLINNPVTFVPLMAGAYQVGHWVLRIDREVPGRPIAANVHAHAGLLHRLVYNGAPSTIVGLFIIAVAAATAAYFVTKLLWRLKVARQWRNRHSAKAI